MNTQSMHASNSQMSPKAYDCQNRMPRTSLKVVNGLRGTRPLQSLCAYSLLYVLLGNDAIHSNTICYSTHMS